MTGYVALLRAVNVGGTGKLPMTMLTQMCEAAGFEKVKTYIASGNVVFGSDRREDQARSALEDQLAYLAETFPDVGLLPTTQERADYYRWMFFATGPLEQAVTNYRAGFVPASEQEFFLGHGSYDRTIDQLEWAVKRHPFIAGDRFTAADVYAGSHIGWGLGLQTLPPKEAFLAYAGKLTTREAYQRALAKDEELLARS